MTGTSGTSGTSGRLWHVVSIRPGALPVELFRGEESAAREAFDLLVVRPAVGLDALLLQPVPSPAAAGVRS